jgi:hypothetical protein
MTRMDAENFKPKAYLKEGCPYSFKYLLFMAEARLLERIEVVRCNPESREFQRVKDMLSAATNDEAKFPTVEIAPTRYLSDSDRLIEHFARMTNIDPNQLPALDFYKKTIFPQLEELHR